ncbi:MAG: DUF6602 domain-containing protein [Cyanophyceae cyanobacterium]
MNNSWSLSQVLASLHDDIQQRLEIARRTFAHPGTKGDASEDVWLELLKTYLPRRYQATKAHVVDSNGKFSDQIDIVIHDRQYSPFIFHYQGETVVPAESVYAVFEAKQSINASEVRYAQAKVASVRTLHRTSLPIPHAGGKYPPKKLFPILGGILTLESDWKPALGSSLLNSLKTDDKQKKLNMGCIATHGTFILREDGKYTLDDGGKSATAFLLELIAQLQLFATVPMIDVSAYANWLR